MPQPARMLVLPSSPGVQIAPRRGANWAILRLGGAAARIAVVSREDQAGRRLRIDLALQPLVEPRLVEVADPAVGVAKRDEGLPSQADVHA